MITKISVFLPIIHLFVGSSRSVDEEQRGKDSGDNEEHAGRPREAITDQNIAKIRDVIRFDRTLRVHTMTELAKLDRKAVECILTDKLHMRKIRVKIVPKVLSDDQKHCLTDVYVDMVEHIATEPNVLESVVTCEET
ncbi:hypothetical protein TNCV_408291 [Trichonephila clavipes]|nr:hypothetical protein TNCV_408291 [Trichonephila clavipes]